MHLSRKQFEKEVKIAMAVKLFEMKKISSGMAASIAEFKTKGKVLTGILQNKCNSFSV